MGFMEKSIFLKVLDGDVPGQVLYQDDDIFAILTIMPHHPGHSLVIPRKQVDKLYDLDEKSYRKVLDFAKVLSLVLEEIYQPKRVGLSVEGLAVPHAHVHVIPINHIGDMDHDKARPASAEQLSEVAVFIRAALQERGYK